MVCILSSPELFVSASPLLTVYSTCPCFLCFLLCLPHIHGIVPLLEHTEITWNAQCRAYLCMLRFGLMIFPFIRRMEESLECWRTSWKVPEGCKPTCWYIREPQSLGEKIYNPLKAFKVSLDPPWWIVGCCVICTVTQIQKTLLYWLSSATNPKIHHKRRSLYSQSHGLGVSTMISIRKERWGYRPWVGYKKRLGS